MKRRKPRVTEVRIGQNEPYRTGYKENRVAARLEVREHEWQLVSDADGRYVHEVVAGVFDAPTLQT
jgi:hypothetical protein